jgi:hypothetical protein
MAKKAQRRRTEALFVGLVTCGNRRMMVLTSFSTRKIKLTTILSAFQFHPSGNWRLMGKETGNHPVPLASVSGITDP